MLQQKFYLSYDGETSQQAATWNIGSCEAVNWNGFGFCPRVVSFPQAMFSCVGLQLVRVAQDLGRGVGRGGTVRDTQPLASSDDTFSVDAGTRSSRDMRHRYEGTHQEDSGEGNHLGANSDGRASLPLGWISRSEQAESSVGSICEGMRCSFLWVWDLHWGSGIKIYHISEMARSKSVLTVLKQNTFFALYFQPLCAYWNLVCTLHIPLYSSCGLIITLCSLHLPAR